MKYAVIGSGKFDLAFTIGFGSRERNVVRAEGLEPSRAV
jgi:hypothetical protein